MSLGSPAVPIYIVPDADLKKNGGTVAIFGMPATPVTGDFTPPDGSVTTDKLADGAVTTPKLADGSATAAKIDSESATNGQVLTADGAGGTSWEDAGGGGGATFTANPDTQILVWDSEGIGATPIEAQVDVTTRIPAAATASVVWFWVRLTEDGGSALATFSFRAVGSEFSIPAVSVSANGNQFLLMMAPLTDGEFEITASGNGASVVVRVYPLAVV